MADTTVSPNNAKVTFKGKGKPMAKSKSVPADAAPSSKQDRDWEAEDALRTMQRAQEHEQDPAMMKRVATHAKKQTDAMDGVLSKLKQQGLVSDKAAAKLVNRRTAPRK